jgi:DNA polymerase III subunit beta
MDVDTVVGTGLKITCERDELVQRVGIVSRAVSTRSAVQVLAGVRLNVEGGGLEAAATDMEMSLRTTVAADIEGEGSLVVPGKLLADVVRLLPDRDVVIEHRADEGVVHISSGTYSSRLNIYGAEDFPRLPAVDVPLHEIDRASLLDTVQRVARSASRDESRPVLTGILVRFEGTTLTMAATDSYRLSVKETELSSAGPELEAIIPARALAEVARIGADADTIQLGAHDNYVVFGAGDTWLTSRRIDGQFPNIKQLLPETFEVEVDLPRGELLDVVRRAAVLAQRSPLRLAFAEGELTISTQSQDVGETHESIPAPYTGAEPLEIGFNAEFLRDGLESFSHDAETVRLKLINPLRPGLITTEGDAFWYLIMPIRLAG